MSKNMQESEEKLAKPKKVAKKQRKASYPVDQENHPALWTRGSIRGGEKAVKMGAWVKRKNLSPMKEPRKEVLSIFIFL